jgi:4-deoxy-L-threo-5-hexosulose-uronate ketol-isomerase
MVVGGAVPGSEQLHLPAWTEVLGVTSHLERRALGIINVGEPGHVLVDGENNDYTDLFPVALEDL